MLDHNLPTFYLREPKDVVKPNTTIQLSRPNSDPEPAYSLRHMDPSSPAAKNCYAIALYDCWNTEVCYGEVSVRPDWSQSNTSQEAVRGNGGVPLPPEPIMPTQFTIQLYNPDQQVLVTQKPASLMGTSHWDFSMPQRSFRAPSISKLDRVQDDPTLMETTPQINFSWKREGKLSKDLVCGVTGKSTDVVSKKRNKEPDITIAIFKALKEITIYEPNLYRVEMEDPKGLEVVLLLGAIAIRDVYFGNARQAFNMSENRNIKDPQTSVGVLAKVTTNTSPTGPKKSATLALGNPTGAALGGLYQQPPRTTTQGPGRQDVASPPTDPGTKYEIDQETARLRAQSEREEREERRKQEVRRREQERLAEAETKRLKKVFEAEQKEEKRRQAEIDRETDRLRKQFGVKPVPQVPQTRLQPPGLSPWATAPIPPAQRPHSAQGYAAAPPVQYQPNNIYQNPTMSGGLRPPGPNMNAASDPANRNRRRSIWGLRGA